VLLFIIVIIIGKNVEIYVMLSWISNINWWCT